MFIFNVPVASVISLQALWINPMHACELINFLHACWCFVYLYLRHANSDGLIRIKLFNCTRIFRKLWTFCFRETYKIIKDETAFYCKTVKLFHCPTKYLNKVSLIAFTFLKTIQVNYKFMLIIGGTFKISKMIF